MSDHRDQSRERWAALLGFLFVSVVVGCFVMSLPQMPPHGELVEHRGSIEQEMEPRGDKKQPTAAREFRKTKNKTEIARWETQDNVKLLGLNSSIAEKSMRQNLDEREQIRAGLEKLRGQENEEWNLDVENAKQTLENVAVTWTTFDKNIEYVME